MGFRQPGRLRRSRDFSHKRLMYKGIHRLPAADAMKSSARPGVRTVCDWTRRSHASLPGSASFRQPHLRGRTASRPFWTLRVGAVQGLRRGSSSGRGSVRVLWSFGLARGSSARRRGCLSAAPAAAANRSPPARPWGSGLSRCVRCDGAVIHATSPCNAGLGSGPIVVIGSAAPEAGPPS